MNANSIFDTAHEAAFLDQDSDDADAGRSESRDTALAQLHAAPTSADDTGAARADARRTPDAPRTASHAGYTLHSHYQPIFSLVHGRAVGHEALLRASDAKGQPVPPPEFFGVADTAELLWRDRLARSLHSANCARQAPRDQWLFLNLHPQVFVQPVEAKLDAFLGRTTRTLGLRPEQLVLEVLEAAVHDDADFDAAVVLIRSHGALIALDDFGAGHSNFDRVWRLRPEIVKLDRSLVVRAAREPRARRIVTQMVSLLHECGALVLMEGVETAAEAAVALEADVDLVQGYHFGRPQAMLAPAGAAHEQIERVWAGFGSRWRDDDSHYRERVRPYLQAIEQAAAQLRTGSAFEVAIRNFIALGEAEVCYLLGEDGRQIGGNRWGASTPPRGGDAFAPFRDTRGARWASRPYFRRAMAAAGQVQITRPYRTLHGAHMCVTVSVAFATPGGEMRVVCGDFSWG